IEQGGTTLRDFVGGDGKPGYFQQTLLVYGRGGEPCTLCSKLLKETRLGQRTTVFCSSCQRSEEHTSELQSRENIVCRLLLEKNKQSLPLVPFDLAWPNVVVPTAQPGPTCM